MDVQHLEWLFYYWAYSLCGLPRFFYCRTVFLPFHPTLYLYLLQAHPYLQFICTEKNLLLVYSQNSLGFSSISIVHHFAVFILELLPTLSTGRHFEPAHFLLKNTTIHLHNDETLTIVMNSVLFHTYLMCNVEMMTLSQVIRGTSPP